VQAPLGVPTELDSFANRAINMALSASFYAVQASQFGQYETQAGRCQEGRARTFGDMISAVNTSAGQSGLEALETFIIDNDDLMDLEARVGRFNIFDALKLDRTEIRHSNLLAWLLDPAESHGCGDLFLKAVFIDMLRRAGSMQRPLNPVELDDVNLQGVEILREWNHVDILIRGKSPKFAVVIENKTDSREHGSQLRRYDQTVERLHPDLPRLCVFLTVDGDEPSHEKYVRYTYADLHRVLARCQRAFAGSIGPELGVVLDHYLRLIGSRFMQNEEIIELCRRIYKNHRQAIDLINQHAGAAQGKLTGKIAEKIEQDPRWKLVSKSEGRVDFVPVSWIDAFPAIGKRKAFDKRCWVVLKFRVSERRCTAGAYVYPTTDPDLRLKVIKCLTEQKHFGFRLFSEKIVGSDFTEIGGKKVICEWGDEEPDQEKVLDGVAKHLKDLDLKLAGVVPVLKPVFDQRPAAEQANQ
jgi:hypothetical protein